MLDSVDEVIRHVEAGIPADFPDRIASPVLNGMRKQRDSHLTVGTGWPTHRYGEELQQLLILSAAGSLSAVGGVSIV